MKNIFWEMENKKVANPFAIGHNVFSKDECQAIIDWCTNPDNMELQEGRYGTHSIVNHDVRKTTVGFLPTKNDIRWIVERITYVTEQVNNEYFRYDLSFQEEMQFGMYQSDGGHYDWHLDQGHAFTMFPRKLSWSLMLSDPNDFEGGELKFNVGSIETAPVEQGSVYFFDSNILHTVTPVTKGTRCSLVGWVCGAPFK
jgi:PKHD-type hydroxylase